MKTKIEKRLKRKKNIRKKIHGTIDKPRLTVFKSNQYFYAQAINDQDGNTVCALRATGKKSDDIAKAAIDFGELLKAKKIDKVVFDRNGYKFHGNVKLFNNKLIESGITI